MQQFDSTITIFSARTAQHLNEYQIEGTTECLLALVTRFGKCKMKETEHIVRKVVKTSR